MATATTTTTAPAAAAASAPLWTCLSCAIGFTSPDAQREHYRSDLHRYNMKRRVAGLPYVRQDVFDAKLGHQSKTAAAGSDTGASAPVEKEVAAKETGEGKCTACAKTFASTNAYRSHVASRKHKEAEARFAAKSAAAGPSSAPAAAAAPVASAEDEEEEASGPLNDMVDLSEALAAPSASAAASAAARLGGLEVSADASEAEIEAAIDLRIASSKRIDPRKRCIFCLQSGFASLDESLEHMQRQHGFFVPEQEYLTDREGLLVYLSDKVAIGHLCLNCNGRGRGFASAEAARKHMVDKSHCKLAYEADEDVMELSDFYDFTSSYPDAADWEDLSGSDVDADDADAITEDGSDKEDEDDLPAASGIRYGDNEMELVLPSGARLGHRSMRRYYAQHLRAPAPGSESEPASAQNGRALAHRLAHHAVAQRMREGSADNPDGTLVSQRGGHVVKARNRGEARDAKRHINEFRDVKRREEFKTKVGFRGNNQKHYRDFLLQ